MLGLADDIARSLSVIAVRIVVLAATKPSTFALPSASTSGENQAVASPNTV